MAASTAFSAELRWYPRFTSADSRSDLVSASDGGRGTPGTPSPIPAGSLSFSSRPMRSAVFRPMPGMLVEPRDVLRAHRAHELLGLDARERRERDLRPDAAHADQPLEQLLLQRGREPVQRELVLPDVRVDAQRHLAPGSGSV